MLNANRFLSWFDRWFLKPMGEMNLIEAREARLATGLAFVAVIGIAIRAFLFTPAISLYAAFFLTLVCYFLTRTQWRKVGAFLLLIVFLTPSFINLMQETNPTPESVSQRMAWTIFPLILSSGFFSPKGILLYILTYLLALFGIQFFAPQLTMTMLMPTFGIFVVAASLLLVVVIYRNYIETLRQTELKTSNEKLRESEALLEQRVVERTKELEEARKEAEEASKVKSQFLANMSHELRTPLNAILNFTAFVADGIMGPVNEEQVSTLQESIASGKHLLALINDILDVSKIEAGLMDLFIQDVDMNEVINATASVAKGLVKDKSIELRVEIEGDLPKTYGDKRRLRQVFLNLISNAVKFTSEGYVAIRANMQSERLRVEVEDTGSGIAQEDFERIFESFKQAKHDNLEAVGTGLGLPISKYFIESHGGKMWLESTRGKGSIFFVELPILSEDEAKTLTLSLAN